MAREVALPQLAPAAANLPALRGQIRAGKLDMQLTLDHLTQPRYAQPRCPDTVAATRFGLIGLVIALWLP